MLTSHSPSVLGSPGSSVSMLWGQLCVRRKWEKVLGGGKAGWGVLAEGCWPATSTCPRATGSTLAHQLCCLLQPKVPKSPRTPCFSHMYPSAPANYSPTLYTESEHVLQCSGDLAWSLHGNGRPAPTHVAGIRAEETMPQ